MICFCCETNTDTLQEGLCQECYVIWQENEEAIETHTDYTEFSLDE